MSSLRLLGICLCVFAVSACTTSNTPGPDGGGNPPVDGGGGPTVDGGGGPTVDGGGGMVSFSSNVIPILDTCTGCHYPGGYANLDLTSGNAYGNLVGVQSSEGCGVRVTKGSASSSYLYDKVSGQNICYGRQMPLGRRLTTSQIKTIADWINEGAPNN